MTRDEVIEWTARAEQLAGKSQYSPLTDKQRKRIAEMRAGRVRATKRSRMWLACMAAVNATTAGIVALWSSVCAHCSHN
jgi:hypothetical protein